MKNKILLIPIGGVDSAVNYLSRTRSALKQEKVARTHRLAVETMTMLDNRKAGIHRVSRDLRTSDPRTSLGELHYGKAEVVNFRHKKKKKKHYSGNTILSEIQIGFV